MEWLIVGVGIGLSSKDPNAGDRFLSWMILCATLILPFGQLLILELSRSRSHIRKWAVFTACSASVTSLLAIPVIAFTLPITNTTMYVAIISVCSFLITLIALKAGKTTYSGKYDC